MQVRKRWKPLVNTCFAGYGESKARIRPGDEFNIMWHGYDNITAVELVINSTLIEADEMPASVAQVNARKAILDGFKYKEKTKAGIYRGRLNNIY